MGKIPELQTKTGNRIYVACGSREVFFPDDPEIPQEYRGKIIMVGFENHEDKGKGVKVYELKTGKVITGRAKQIVIDDLCEYPL